MPALKKTSVNGEFLRNNCKAIFTTIDNKNDKMYIKHTKALDKVGSH